MRIVLAFALAATGLTIAAQALAQPTSTQQTPTQQTCLRPKWTECLSFPNGGRHTGTDPYGKRVQLEVPPGSNICVRNEWEIEAETFVQFSRNGVPWPHPDWEVREDSFCLYKQ